MSDTDLVEKVSKTKHRVFFYYIICHIYCVVQIFEQIALRLLFFAKMVYEQRDLKAG